MSHSFYGGPVPVVVIVAIVLVVASLVGWLVYFNLDLARRIACGFWSWEVGRMRREGTRATAAVLARTSDTNGPGAYLRFELIAEVRPQGAPSFRATIAYLSRSFGAFSREGAELPVLFHPGDPSRVLIDFDAIERTEQIAADEKKAREEQRKRDLLAGRGP